MKITQLQIGSALLLLMIGLALPAWSQTQATQPVTEQAAAEQPPANQPPAETTQTPVTDDTAAAVDTAAPVPLPVNNGANPLAFTSEQERSNYLRGGLSVGATYDDNALNSSTDKVGNFAYSILPHIEWDQATSRFHWTFNYAVGLVVNQELAQKNSNAQAAGVNFEYRLSPHVNVVVRDQFAYTSGFLGGSYAGSPVGGVTQPNNSVITPLAQQTTNTGTAAITYQFGAGSMVGASGTFYLLHFGDVSGTQTLQDTNTRQADGFYTHRLTPKNWAGIDYQFQYLTFQQNSSSTVTNSILFFDTIYLQKHMSLSFYGGPQYSQVTNTIPVPEVTVPVVAFKSVQSTTTHWSGAGGAKFNWQGEHTSLFAGASRGVSNGGGLLPTVVLTQVNGSVRRQLTFVSSIELGAGYSVSDGLGGVLAATNNINSATGSISYSRRMGSSLNLNLGYARDYQLTKGITLGDDETNHNRGWVTISYDFSRPLGR